ncbi:MAG: fibronectin-binding autotransporter adhesin, partial [Humisphaera sp.]|nr:fibronectin-binding autotransporter adhesin [Humisphaera sp.]
VGHGRAFNIGGQNIVCNGGMIELANVGLERVVTLNNGSGMRGTGPFATALGNIEVGVSGPATVALETGASAADFLVMNGITGTAASTINVGGSGTVRLPFNTSFGGVWNVNSGTLRVDNAASLGFGTSTVNLASGATLLLNNATVARAVALDHGATLIGAATGGITGAVSMGGSDQVTFNASAASDVLNISGGVTGGAGSSTITIPGAGIVSLSQPSTWAGVWIVNSSRLRMTNQNQLGSSFNEVQLNGTSTLLVNGTTTSDHPVRVVASTIDVTTGNTLTLTKQLTGSGPGPTLTKTGGGMLTLAAGSNFSVGGMTVSGGVLRMGGAWSSGSFTVGAAALETNQTFTNAITLNNGAALRSAGGSATDNGVNTIASGANVTLGTSAASEVLTFGSGLPFTGGGGGAVINISGPGRVAINQMNNVTASWKINTGATLQIANNNRLGNVANSVTLDGGTLETTASASLSRPFTFNAGTIRVNTGGLGLSGAITAGPLGGFIKTGPGILYLGGTQTFPIGTSINVNEGTLTITSDPGFGTPRAVYLVINNGSLDLAGSTMQLDTLYMADGTTGTMSPFGARSTLVVNSFSLSGTARIDVAKNNVVVRANSVGTPEDGVYGDITGLIQSAYNGGAWDGPGLTTSMADALSGLTTLGVASADETGRTGSLFGGVTLESGDVIVAYTYSGDANLDGFISGDDYSAIDFNVGTAVSGWYNGDFNYDSIISGDDYSTIDFNYAAQGDPFNFGSAAGGAAAGITAVPEPTAAVGILLLTPIFALSRRRRRRVDSTQTCV